MDIVSDLVSEAQNRDAVGRRAPRALIVPPAGWGSLGDVAMLNGALSALKASGITSVDVALPPPEEVDSAPFDNFIGGLDWFYKGNPEDQARLHRHLDDYSHVLLVGADCIDGSYNPKSIIRRIELVGEAMRRGSRGRILGASFNENPDEQCVEALRHFPADGDILARDPASRHRMEQSIGRAIVQTADLAFLCPPDPHHGLSSAVLEWIAGQRGEGRRVVALNINANIGRTIDGFVAAHRAIIERLLEQRVSIVLVPNDVRTEKNDEYFLRLAARKFFGEAARWMRWLPARHPSATKAVLGAVDLLISSRMHAAILAAGAGRPSFCFVYQGKFEGLYDMLGLDQQSLLFSPDELVASPAAMADHALSALARAETLAATLRRSLPAVHQLAMRNVSGLTG